MAVTEYLLSLIGTYLKDREEPIAAIRATARGTVATSALLAGAGAVGGYFAAQAMSDGVLAAAFGGGVGAATGMLLGAVIGSFRMRGAAGIRSSTVVLVLTRRRLLVFRTFAVSNKPSGLAREIPIDAIAAVEVGKAGLLAAQPVIVTLTDGSSLAFESARLERAPEFAGAFTRATGR